VVHAAYDGEGAGTDAAPFASEDVSSAGHPPAKPTKRTRRSSGKVARWTAEEEIRLKVPPRLPRSRSRQHRLHLGGSSYKQLPGSILHPDLILSLLLSPPLRLPP